MILGVSSDDFVRLYSRVNYWSDAVQQHWKFN